MCVQTGLARAIKWLAVPASHAAAQQSSVVLLSLRSDTVIVDAAVTCVSSQCREA